MRFDRWTLSSDFAGAQTNTELKAAPGAGLWIEVDWVAISNGAVAGNVTILDGSGGTVLFEAYIDANSSVHFSGLGIELTANTALVLTSTTVTTHAINAGGAVVR